MPVSLALQLKCHAASWRAVMSILQGKFCLCANVIEISGANDLFLSSLGQGGHAYLKEWLWWAGLLSSKLCFCFHSLKPAISLNLLFNLQFTQHWPKFAGTCCCSTN